MATQQQKGEAFRALHQGDPFVIPNPWDAGSAKILAGLGFKALATTSGGFAFTLGRHDGAVTLDEVAAHVTAVNEATDLPVSVDLENGYGPAPEDAAAAITRAAEAGAVGGSIEDYDRDDEELYEPRLAAERVAAAAEAAGALDSKPVNVLAFSRLGLTLSELAEAGAQRVSVGSGLTWAATDGLIEAAERIIDDGDFSGTATPGRVREWL